MKHKPPTADRLKHVFKHISNQAELGAGVVYFIQCNEFVKIGFAADPVSRMCQMQIGNPYTLKLLKVIQSITPEQLEQEIHGRIEPYRVRGEWFKLPQDVLDALLSL
jgi:hypothetical protein